MHPFLHPFLYPINTPYQHTPLTQTINPPSQHIIQSCININYNFNTSCNNNNNKYNNITCINTLLPQHPTSPTSIITDNTDTALRCPSSR